MYMNYLAQGLWATPIYQSRVELTDTLRDHVRGQQFDRFRLDNGSCTRDTRLLEQPQLALLKSQILAHVQVWTRQELHVAEHIEFYLLNSWCTRHDHGDLSERHTHDNSLISGVVYIDCDELSGDLTFYRDFNHLNLWPSAVSLDTVHYTPTTAKYWWIRPQVGDIVLFPSHLAHGVPPSRSPHPRHCVAFNLYARGSIGQQSDPPITGLDLA